MGGKISIMKVFKSIGTIRQPSSQAGLGLVQAFVIFLVGSVTLSVLYHMKSTWSHTTAHNEVVGEMHQRANKIFDIMAADLLSSMVALSDCSLTQKMRWLDFDSKEGGQFLELYAAKFQDVFAAKPKGRHFQVSSNHSLINDQDIIICNGETLESSQVEAISSRTDAGMHKIAITGDTGFIDWSMPTVLAKAAVIKYFLIAQGGTLTLARQDGSKPRKAIAKGIQGLWHSFNLEGALNQVDSLSYGDQPMAVTIHLLLAPKATAKKIKKADIETSVKFEFSRTLLVPPVNVLPVKYATAVSSKKDGELATVRLSTIK
jgi:hypothetical protein